MQRVCIFDSGRVRHDVFDEDDLPPVLADLRSENDDVQVLPPEVSLAPPELVVMDVDSTLINEEVIDLLAAHAGVENQVAEITERAMAGELDFEESLRERVALLKGVPVSALAEVADQVTLTPGVPEWVEALHEVDCRVAVVSGGFIDIVQPLADGVGIDDAFANQLESSGGVLTGKVTGPVVDRAFKAQTLAELAKRVGATRTLAIGDGANDLDMVELASCGIAFCAKPALAEKADLVIRHRDMRQLVEIFCTPYVR